MKLVIGLIGPPLAGKETVGNVIGTLLKNDGHTVSRHRFSDILRDTLTLWDIPHGRENEQPLAQWMVKFKDGALTHAVKSRLMKDDAEIGILDGVRWYSDEKMIREFPASGIKSIIIYINSNDDTRYKRLQARNRHGEAELSREDFDRQGRAENETYIPEIGSRADITIENNFESIEEFQKYIENVYREKIKLLI